MASPSYARSLVSSFKRLRIRTISQSTRSAARPVNDSAPAAASLDSEPNNAVRLPKAVQAIYLNPLRREITHDIPSCDLQLRSYSVRNLEVFADFAMRAAYFLRLPAKGPVPLRRITERFTVPRSNFIHKKSQENFERVTVRRWIRIVDGHPETVALWLAFLRKHAYYGVGMKANVYENGGLDVAADLDREQEAIGARLGEVFEVIGGRKKLMLKKGRAERMLLEEPFKGTWGANAALGGAPGVEMANRRIASVKVKPGRGA